MKKILVSILFCFPLIVSAQTVLTPQQELEQAQKQLEAAKVALEQAKMKAEQAKAAAEKKAKAHAEARAKAAEIQKQIEATKAETARLKQEAERVQREAAHQAEIVAKQRAEAEAAQKVADQKVEQVEVTEQQATSSHNGWIEPKPTITRQPATTAMKAAKEAESNYISASAVPEVNGKIQWSKTYLIPSLSAKELYDKALNFLNVLTQEENQLENSKVVLVNPTEHSILATIHEKLVFSSSLLALDQAKFRYALQVKCSDGKATLTMSRLTYDYKQQDQVTHYVAEEWISNRVALNKKGTRMYPISGKFRRSTINRKNQIFEGFKQALSEGAVSISE